MVLERWEKLGLAKVCWGEMMCLEEINISKNQWAEHQPSLLRLIWRSAPETILSSRKLENPNILRPYLNTSLKGTFLVDAFCSLYELICGFYAVHSQSGLYWRPWWRHISPVGLPENPAVLPSADALQQMKPKSESLLDDISLHHFFVSQTNGFLRGSKDTQLNVCSWGETKVLERLKIAWLRGRNRGLWFQR